MRMLVRQMAVVFMLVTLSLQGHAGSGDFVTDLKARRERLMQLLGPDTILVLFSAPVRTFSNDVEYEYRQDSSLYYLTGLDQEDTILVMMPGNQTRKAILFVRKPDPAREHRQGHTLSIPEATAQSGIDTVYLAGEFEPFVEAMLARRPYGLIGERGLVEFERFFTALAAGRARMALLLTPKPGLSGPLSAAFEFARTVRDRYIGLTIQDAADPIFSLRQVKTPYEQSVLERSVEISSDAHIAGMNAAHPDAYEL